MQLTANNQVEITKEVIETVDLIQLDTEIAHWKDVINQAQGVINSKQILRDSITNGFPTIEKLVYPDPIKEVKPLDKTLV